MATALPAPDCQPHAAAMIAACAILVVDDDKSMRQLLRHMLERAGFKVLVAANGRQALKSFAEHEIAAVVTDIMMPIMDGLRLTRELLAVQPDVAIIAISGSDVRLEIARQLGAKALLRKPVESDDLVETVRQLTTQPATLD